MAGIVRSRDEYLHKLTETEVQLSLLQKSYLEAKNNQEQAVKEK